MTEWKEGTKLKFVCKNPITWAVSKDNAKCLKNGEIYTIEHVAVHHWHTKIFLREFPGIEFNSVWFDEVN